MKFDIFQFPPFLTLLVQYIRYQVPYLRGGLFNKVQILSHNLLEQFFNIIVLEWQEPTNHREKNDAGTPDISLLGRVSLTNEHLGQGITWRTARRFQLTIVLEMCAQSEVNNFDVHITSEQNILWLEISMDNIETVHVLDCRD